MFPANYEMRVMGVLPEYRRGWFGPMRLTQDGETTLLTGRVNDQAELYGLIDRARDLGLVLLSLRRTETGESPVRI